MRNQDISPYLPGIQTWYIGMQVHALWFWVIIVRVMSNNVIILILIDLRLACRNYEVSQVEKVERLSPPCDSVSVWGIQHTITTITTTSVCWHSDSCFHGHEGENTRERGCDASAAITGAGCELMIIITQYYTYWVFSIYYVSHCYIRVNKLRRVVETVTRSEGKL